MSRRVADRHYNRQTHGAVRVARTIYEGRPAQPRWQDLLRDLLAGRDPRRVFHCKRCDGLGMVGDPEDVCPACEGGVWANVEPWRSYFNALHFPFGLRFSVHRLRIYKDSAP